MAKKLKLKRKTKKIKLRLEPHLGGRLKEIADLAHVTVNQVILVILAIKILENRDADTK